MKLSTKSKEEQKREDGLSKRREDLKRKRDEETQKTIERILTKQPRKRRNRKGEEFVDESLDTKDTISYIVSTKDGEYISTLNITDNTNFGPGNKFYIK